MDSLCCFISKLYPFQSLSEKENLEKIDDDDSQGSGAYQLDEIDSDGDYLSPGEGDEVNDSAVNTSAEDNYDGYEGGELT